VNTQVLERPSFAIIVGLSIAVCTLVSATTGMAGDEHTNPSPSAGAAGTRAEVEIGPRGEHMPQDIKYSAWRKVCFKAPDAKTLCRTTSEGTWDTGQVAVRVDLIERAGGVGRLQIFVPVGLYLQPGIKVTIDRNATIPVPYNWCLTNMCVAATLANPDLVQELLSGKTFKLEVVDSNFLTVATSLPLDQFASIRDGAPAQVFEYQLDDR
jgi:invasion protein IalB